MLIKHRNLKIDAGIAPSSGAIWDKFSDQQ